MQHSKSQEFKEKYPIIRRAITWSTWENLFKLVSNVPFEGRISKADLKIKSLSKIKGYNSALKDAKIMGLLGNGNGIYFKELGKEFLANPDDKELRKKIILNVPIHYLCSKTFPEKVSRGEIERWMKERTKGYHAFLSSMVTRFFETFYPEEDKNHELIRAVSIQSLKPYQKEEQINVLLDKTSYGKAFELEDKLKQLAKEHGQENLILVFDRVKKGWFNQ